MQVSRRGFAFFIGAQQCLCLPAVSQDRDRGRENEPRGLVARVQAHFVPVERATRAGGRERDRYENARKHLAELRELRERFDRGELEFH
jgi:hypothetical protein